MKTKYMKNIIANLLVVFILLTAFYVPAYAETIVGQPQPSPLPVSDDNVFIDECDTLDKIYEISNSKIAVSTKEEMVAKRKNDSAAITAMISGTLTEPIPERWIKYRVPDGIIKSLAVWTYFSGPTWADLWNYNFYLSPDDETYTKVNLTISDNLRDTLSATSSGWHERMYYSLDLSGYDARYIKVEYTSGNNVTSDGTVENRTWEGEVGKVQFAYGEKDPVEMLETFVTRDGHKLYDGDKRFRFVSFAIPSLAFNEDGGYFPTNEYEIRDGLESAKQLGATAVRIHTLAIDKGNLSHITSVGYDDDGNPYVQFNEAAFRSLDKVLQLCNEYGVRIIFPIIDGNDYWGGIHTLAAWRGKTITEYWTDKQCRDDIKAIYNYVLNRTNYYTGVKYKDDPAVLCWQLGNEMNRYRVPDDWASEMAAYVKSIDSNHLVACPQQRYWKGIVNDPNIDIMDCHYYEQMPFETWLEVDADACTDKKALIFSEIGFRTGEQLGEFLDLMLGRDEVAGGCIWGISLHNRNGGMYRHGSSSNNADKYTTYNYPGFDNERVYENMQEKYLFDKVRQLAYKLRDEAAPQLMAPDVPKLLPVTDAHDIRFRGSTGASTYDIERATSVDGPWSVVGSDFEDNIRVWVSGNVLFDDTTAEDGAEYYYRVKAKNQYGESAWSNIRKLGDSALDAELLNEENELQDAKNAGDVKVIVPEISQEIPVAQEKVIQQADYTYYLEKQLYDSFVFSTNHNFAVVKYGVEQLSADENVKPFMENDVMYIPVDILNNMFDCDARYETTDSTIVIDVYGKTVVTQPNSNILTIQEDSIEVTNCAKAVGDVAYLPLDMICSHIFSNENLEVIYNGDYGIVTYDSSKIASGLSAYVLRTSLNTLFANPIKETVEPTYTYKNLLNNSGFESGDILDSWTVPSDSLSVSSERSYSGSYSLKAVGVEGYPGIRQVVPCKKNTYYRLTYYKYTPAYLSGKDYQINFKVIDNASLKELSSNSVKTNTESTEWEEIVTEFNSGTASALRVALVLGPSGTHYIDDIMLEEIMPEVKLSINGAESISDLTPDTLLSVSAEIQGDINGTTTGSVLIAAVYNGENLITMGIYTDDSENEAEQRIIEANDILILPDSLKNCVIKLFLWKDFKTIEPIIESEIIG